MSDLAPMHPRTMDRLLNVLEERHFAVLAALSPTAERTTLDVCCSVPPIYGCRLSGQQANGTLQGLHARGLVKRVERTRASDKIRWLVAYRGQQVLQFHLERAG